MGWSLDSNIILYCLDDDPLAQQKKLRSQTLVSESLARQNILANQVCGEVFRVMHSKLQLPSAQALQFLERVIDGHRLVQASPDVLKQAMRLAVQSRRQFWDCLIIATCAAAGVKRLYTEDTGSLPHLVLGVELVNPFLLESWDATQLES
jgi:predicted nucleic acid-binding protein